MSRLHPRQLGTLLVWTAIALAFAGWIGSYVYIRNLQIQSIGTWMCGSNTRPGDHCHTVPEWAAPLESVYRPLIFVDSQITGVRIHFHQVVQF